jgi:predicted signal transduction protein with EAL and GGDEF domain
MRYIVKYNLRNVLSSWPHTLSLRMSLSPTQIQVLQGRVQELLVVIESHQAIMGELLDAASEDTSRTKDKTRSTDAHAMLSCLEVQTQDLQNVADDLDPPLHSDP